MKKIAKVDEDGDYRCPKCKNKLREPVLDFMKTGDQHYCTTCKAYRKIKTEDV